MAFSHLSASQITLFKDGCSRRWYEIYVNGNKEPSSASQEKGQAVHALLEDYILHEKLPPTDTEEGMIANSGIALLQTCKQAQIYVEQSLDEYPTLIDGVKFKGFIDCLIIHDDFIEILDHKTTSAKKYMKTEFELAQNVQLTIYALHVMQKYPHIDRFRLSHVYYLTKAPYKAHKVFVDITKQEIQSFFDDHVKDSCLSMVKAYEQSIEDMPKNNDYCFSYGQRCPFYSSCKDTSIKLDDLITTTTSGATTSPDLLAYLLGGNAPTQAPTQPQPIVETITKPQPIVERKTFMDQKILFVSSIPVKGAAQVPVAMEALKPLIQEICTKEKVSHISAIQYARGYDMLSSLLTQMGHLPCSMLIDARSFEYQKIGATLESLADIVVRGV
jgi:hypothetical protein